MIKIGTQKEMGKVQQMPHEVIEVMAQIMSILDHEYGGDREVDVYGGYALVVEGKEDFVRLKDEICIDVEADAIPEYVDLIKCSNGVVYTNSLILCNNDFGITLIMNLDITPASLREYILE